MSNETAKTNNNAIAEAEQTIARAIRALPIVSGLFGDAKTEVFASSDESARDIIERTIKRALGLSVSVGIGRVSDVAPIPQASARATLSIEIYAPFVTGEQARATLDIADAIIHLLHCSAWQTPFTEGKRIYLQSVENLTSQDGKSVLRNLTFTAWIDLNNFIEKP